jgi:hypothetical protein
VWRDRFDASTMITLRRALKLTIFSRVWAPPPPLIRSSASLTSSAPSTLTAMSHGPSSPSSGIPSARACARLASEVGTPV